MSEAQKILCFWCQIIRIVAKVRYLPAAGAASLLLNQQLLASSFFTLSHRPDHD
jgi:hypothetical protein